MFPENLFNYFILTSQISEKSTRLTEKSKQTLYIFFHKTLRLQKCIKYQLGVKIYNKIFIPIQNTSYNAFKYEFKSIY